MNDLVLPRRGVVEVAGRDGQLSAALNDSFIGDMVKIAGAQTKLLAFIGRMP